MLILAIDTAADYCAIALHENGKALNETIIETQRDQAKILAPLTKEILDKHNVKPRNIDRFAIATGPGSFTGLRVGLSFVRGLAFANQKQAYGFDHFTITRHALNKPNKPTLIIRDSKRADLFCAWLDADNKLQPYFLSTAEMLIQNMPTYPFSMTGNGAQYIYALAPHLKEKNINLSDSTLIHALAGLTQISETTPDQPPLPLYLRGADVSFPKHASTVS